MSSGSSVNYQAGGNINVSRFVCASYSSDIQVIQATGTTPIIGISQMGPKVAPGIAGAGTLCAVSGDYLGVYQDESTDEPLLFLGATVTGGTMLCSDTNGLGIEFNATSGSAQYIGAEARQSGVSGDLIRVRPRLNVTGRMS